MGEMISIADALKMTIQVLSNINVPAGLINQIGVPISVAIDNLKVCVDACKEKGEGEDGSATDSE